MQGVEQLENNNINAKANVNVNVYQHIIDKNVFPFLFKEESGTKIISKNLVHALCILSFDDEVGQITENFYPEGALNKEMLRNISALGFPENNSLTDEGEVQYLFKIRQSKLY